MKQYTIQVRTPALGEERTYKLNAKDTQEAFDIAQHRYAGTITKMTYLTKLGKTIDLVLPKPSKKQK